MSDVLLRAIASIAFVAVAAAGSGTAGADGGFSIGGRPVWFVTGGATAGGTVAAERGGAFAGGELGLVRLRENRFAGVYADAYYDFGAGHAYATVGPELGLIRRSRTFPIAIGVDGGGAFGIGGGGGGGGDDGDGGSGIGAAGRLFVSLLGSFAVYGRYVYLDGGEHVVQLGVTLKFPLAPPFGAGAP
jgi:hypothetical protein